MSILFLPAEILCDIFQLLPRHTVLRFGSTCKRAYTACLPVLYDHIELNRRSHARNLELGLFRSPPLLFAVSRYTRRLSLRQNGNPSLIANGRLLTHMVNVHTLTLHNVQLSVNTVVRLAAALPNLRHLSLDYCTLLHAEPIEPSLSKAQPVSQAVRLSLNWTDFTASAVDQLFAALPSLTNVSLGANHNRIENANNAAIQSLLNHCSHIRDLSVALQQVTDSSLCSAIALYGAQLERLSIRCGGPQTLWTVAAYATEVRTLVMRAVGHWPKPTSPGSSVQTLEGIRPINEQEAICAEHSMINILKQCRALVRLEMASWTIQDVPAIVWNAMETVAQRRGEKDHHDLPKIAFCKDILQSENERPSVEINRDSWAYYLDEDTPWRMPRSPRRPAIVRPKKTLALGMEELQEIRKQTILFSPSM